MNDALQRFAWVDALLSNWDGIRVRVGMAGPAFVRDVDRLAGALAAARESDAIAILVDRLLDLLDGTAASDYVRDLLRRADISGAGVSRGAIGDVAADVPATEALLRSASALAQVSVTETTFRTVPVYFATNRAVDPERRGGDRFGGVYANEVTYGRADVTIPGHHRIGKLESPRLGLPDKDRHVIVDSVHEWAQASFATALGQAARQAAAPEVLVFVHGYYVTFEEAARRAAQFTADMGFGGVVVLFSWPSAGAFAGYFADEDSAAKSARALGTFLRALEGGPWTRVHIVAHSMGNRVVVTGISSDPARALPLANVVLVAGDIDVGLFEQQFPTLRDAVRPDPTHAITSYATNSDRALWMSRLFHRTVRLGGISGDPCVLDGLETIDATSVDSSLLGHSYFGQERSVLTDLGLLVRQGLRPEARGLRAIGRWWTFPS